MKLAIETIPSEGMDVDLSAPGASHTGAFGSEVDILFRRPVAGRVRVYRLHGEVFVSGALETGVEQTCCRCLEPFELPVEAAVAYTFQPATDSLPEEQELKEEDTRICYYTSGEIDLSQVVIEQVLLSIPMKPICSSECKGLCPQCGSNRNLDACGCEEKRVDPRFGALEKFKVEK